MARRMRPGHHRGQEQACQAEARGDRREHHDEGRGWARSPGSSTRRGARPPLRRRWRCTGRAAAGRPEAIASAIDRGSATTPTTRPASASADQLAPAVALGRGSAGARWPGEARADPAARTRSGNASPATPAHVSPSYSLERGRRSFARRPGSRATETDALPCSDGRPERVRALRVVVPGPTARSRPPQAGRIGDREDGGVVGGPHDLVPQHLRSVVWRGWPSRWREPTAPARGFFGALTVTG
jgi:hypothetical protein